MSPELKAHIAALVVLICDVRRSTDAVHEVVEALAREAYDEGRMDALEQSQRLMEKHLGVLV